MLANQLLQVSIHPVDIEGFESNWRLVGTSYANLLPMCWPITHRVLFGSYWAQVLPLADEIQDWNMLWL